MNHFHTNMDATSTSTPKSVQESTEIITKGIHLELSQKGMRYSSHQTKGGRMKHLSLCTCHGSINTIYDLHPYDVDVVKLEICFWPGLNLYPFLQNLTILFPNLSDIIIHTYTLDLFDFIRQLTKLRHLSSVELNLGVCLGDFMHLRKNLFWGDIEDVTDTYISLLASQFSSTILCKLGYLNVSRSYATPWINSTEDCPLMWKCGHNNDYFGALNKAFKEEFTLRGGVISYNNIFNLATTEAYFRAMKYGCQLESQILDRICTYNETYLGFEVYCRPA